MCPLGPLILAAAGKPPHYSPQRIVDEIRHRGLTMGDAEYAAVKGLPAEWNAAFIRSRLAEALDGAERYASRAPVEVVGCLAMGGTGSRWRSRTTISPRAASCFAAQPKSPRSCRRSRTDWKIGRLRVTNSTSSPASRRRSSIPSKPAMLRAENARKDLRLQQRLVAVGILRRGPAAPQANDHRSLRREHWRNGILRAAAAAVRTPAVGLGTARPAHVE